MQQNEEIYEYITFYVYELEIITSNPNNFIDALKNIHMYNIKVTGKILFLVGCGFFNGINGVL